MMHLIRPSAVLGLALLVVGTVSAQQSPSSATPKAGQAATAPGNGQPFPALTAEQQSRLDQLLQAWQASSKSTQRLSAEFTRWQFRPLQAPAQIHATWSRGTVKYQAPAQGMFVVDEMLFYNGMDDNKTPQYKKELSQPGEWWVCNGKELLEFDRANKKCEVLELPPEMQGQAIVQSPLPFVFNLDAVEMKNRYWMRELPPKQQGEYWLEAWPKHQQDRAEFMKVMVIIDSEKFLPKALMMFPPNFDPRSNPERDVYEFANVQRNGSLIAQKLGEFFGNKFIDGGAPADWKVIRNKYVPLAPQQKMAQNPDASSVPPSPQTR